MIAIVNIEVFMPVSVINELFTFVVDFFLVKTLDS